MKHRFFPAGAALFFFLALILGADAAREGARTGLSLSFQMAIPALFPFFAAGSLLTDTGVTAALGRLCARPMWRLYGLPGDAAGALVLGLTGGYPVGVQAAADLYAAGRLTREQAERLLGFCNNTGPAFIVGVCGAGVFGSVSYGLTLYGIHIFAALLTGLAMTHPGQGAPPDTGRAAVHRPPLSAALVRACERAAQTSIKVAAFITLFAVFTALLDACGALSVLSAACEPLCRMLSLPAHAAQPLTLGALELTRGLFLLPESGLPLRHALPAASMLLAFGGLSVWCQSASLAGTLSLRRCWIGKVLHAMIAGALTVFWCAASPHPLPAFAPDAGAVPVLPLWMRILPIILLTITYGKQRLHRL